jgi:hypothetical protein
MTVTAGLLTGYFAGKPHGVLAYMDGMLSGLMGGLMGTMLGVMLVGEHPLLTIMFMDLIFAMFLFPLNGLLKNRETWTAAVGRDPNWNKESESHPI